MKTLYDGGTFRIIRDGSLVRVKGNPNLNFEKWDVSSTLRLFNVISKLLDECKYVDVCIGGQRVESFIKEDSTSETRVVTQLNVVLDGLSVMFTIADESSEMSICFFNKIDIEHGTIGFALRRSQFKSNYDEIRNKLSRFLENTISYDCFSFDLNKEWFIDSKTGDLIFKDKK